MLGLILLGIGILSWSASYFIGRLVHDKISLVRATDAAVLSAAIQQARVMNFHAYLNRAQLAHRLAMIHLVTLASQERFRATQAQTSLRMNPPAFLIGMFFGSSYATSYLASQAGGVSDHVALRALEQAFNRHDEAIKQIIDQARLALIRDLSALRDQTLEKVLVRNLGDSGSALKKRSLQELGVRYVIERDELKGYIQYFSAQSPVFTSAFNQITDRYEFLKSRNSLKRNVWAVNIKCPHKRHELRRRGETIIHNDGLYESSDTLSMHAVRFNKLIGCYHREYPMGWARINSAPSSSALLAPSFLLQQEKIDDLDPENISSHTSVNSSFASQSFSDQSFWRWVKNQGVKSWNIFNGRENPLAEVWNGLNKIRWRSNVDAGFADIAPTRASFRFAIKTRQDSRLSLQEENAKNDVNNMRSQTTRTNKKQRFFFGKYVDETLTAQSAAHIYFARPDSFLGSYQEIPSLFHPYWHARLTTYK